MFKRSKILSNSCRQQPTILSRKRKAEETVIIETPPSDFVTSGRDSSVNHFTDVDEQQEEDEDEKAGLNGSNLSQVIDERWPFFESQLTTSRRWFHRVTRQSMRSHNSPIPIVNWADRAEVWDIMVDKDNFSYQQKDHRYLERHHGIQPRMRAIVLDWLIEVCEVYRLQRDTYMLAMDFFDRFFTRTSAIEKQNLQLLGITCLFLASKYEEIYPPKLNEFAYVTDGACSREDILNQEIILLKVLDWDASTLTVTDWLHLFLQLCNKRGGDCENLLIPNYSSHFFYQITQLVDLSMMDIGCLRFAHRTIAASALYHMSSLETLRTATSFEWDDVCHCISWMLPFAATLIENGLCDRKFFKEVSDEESHNIQAHIFELTLYDKAIERQNLNLTLAASPVVNVDVLTPPNSNEKPNGDSTDIR